MTLVVDRLPKTRFGQDPAGHDWSILGNSEPLSSCLPRSTTPPSADEIKAALQTIGYAKDA